MSQILIIPNTILRNKSNPIKEVSDNEIILSKKMRKIMNDAPGVGLAAPQLGILKRIITINVKESSDEKNLSYTLFNPEIIKESMQVYLPVKKILIILSIMRWDLPLWEQ